MFEDTKHTIQSAVDGYNVCIFAYGQTGSGKTFTIYGNEKDPGLTPRGVHELFRIINRDSGKYTFSVSIYMLELYQVGNLAPFERCLLTFLQTLTNVIAIAGYTHGPLASSSSQGHQEPT